MSIYDELTPIAAGVLKEFKQGFIQYVQLSAASGTVDEPGTITETKTTADGTARGVSAKYIMTGAAAATDFMVTIAPIAGVTPNARDFIEIDNERYKIVLIVPLPAAGPTIVWKFIVRRGDYGRPPYFT